MRRQPGLDTQPVRCHYADQPADRPNCQLAAVIAYGTLTLCTDCNLRRSTIGRTAAPRRLPPPAEPLDVLDWITHADSQLRQAQNELAAAVHRARTQGHPWHAIGHQLGITRQAAQQRFRQNHPPPG